MSSIVVKTFIKSFLLDALLPNPGSAVFTHCYKINNKAQQKPKKKEGKEKREPKGRYTRESFLIKHP